MQYRVIATIRNIGLPVTIAAWMSACGQTTGTSPSASVGATTSADATSKTSSAAGMNGGNSNSSGGSSGNSIDGVGSSTASTGGDSLATIESTSGGTIVNGVNNSAANSAPSAGGNPVSTKGSVTAASSGAVASGNGSSGAAAKTIGNLNSSIAQMAPYPYCTNGSNTGGGYGWDTSVTATNGSHSCLVPPAPAQAQTATATSSKPYPTCTNGSNTGGGYGWDPGVTDPRGSHSCLVPNGSTGSTAATGALSPLSIAAAGNAAFKITDYGSTLQTNKDTLKAAAAAAGATVQETAVIIAMAMQETTLMEIWQRDASKDYTASANSSILNMNYDMLTKLGYTANDYGASLNEPGNLTVAVGYLLKAFHTWGIQSTLNYQRGGYTGFQDGYSYGVGDYRNAIMTIYDQMVNSPALTTDGRRVEINVVHV